MKWLIAMAAGVVSGLVIASVTDEVAIAAASGAGIGILATIALFGTRPVHSVFKVAGAMAIGSMAGWLVALLTDHLTSAMALGAAVGVLATIAVASERPVRALLKTVAVMGLSFVIGWQVGHAFGHPRLGLALALPLSLPFLLLIADTMTKRRHRPF